MLLKLPGQWSKRWPPARSLSVWPPLRLGLAGLAQRLDLEQPPRRLSCEALGLASLGVIANVVVALIWQQPELALAPSLVVLVVAASTMLVGRRQLEQLERAAVAAASERARAEAALADQHARQRQVELDLVKVAHDLADPLTVVSGYGRLLLAQADSDGSRRMAQQVVRAADRLALLMADLKATSQGQAAGDSATTPRGEVDLCALARDITDDYRAVALQHQLAVETPRAAVLVRGELAALSRVVSNLVSNAVRYSPPGSVVHLSVQADDEQHAVLRVEDHGIGIPEDERERIFDPFYRASNATPFAAGTGIGLAGMREIVAHHGGSISVDSRLGVGTTFEVRLPMIIGAPV